MVALFLLQSATTLPLATRVGDYEKDTVEDGYPYQRDRDDFGS